MASTAVAFAADLAGEDARQETWRDYALAQNAGVRGFPTLIIGPRLDGRYEPVTRGFRPAEEVLAAIEAKMKEH